MKSLSEVDLESKEIAARTVELARREEDASLTYTVKIALSPKAIERLRPFEEDRRPLKLWHWLAQEVTHHLTRIAFPEEELLATTQKGETA